MGPRASACLLSVMMFLGGCNALLGTEEGVFGPADPSAVVVPDDAGSDDGERGSTESESPGAEPQRDDSKPPCDPCSAELVVRTSGPPSNVHVQGSYVYFTDYGGAYRVDRTKLPCETDACKEAVAIGSFSVVGVSSKLVCWSNSATFGCASTSDLTKRKEVAATSLAVASRAAMLFDSDSVYFARGDNDSQPDTLFGGPAWAMAARTSTAAAVSEMHARIGSFALSSGLLVWNQEKDGAQLMIKPLGAGTARPIALPNPKANISASSLALHGNYVYLSLWHGAQVYRAPIDGSEATKPILEVGALGSIAVNGSGIYMTFGDYANGWSNGVAWSSLDPTAPDATSKILVQPEKTPTGLDVADDGIYYPAEDSKIWRIKFQ